MISLPGGSLKITLTIPLRVNRSQNFCVVNLGIKGSRDQALISLLIRSAVKSNFSPISRDVHILQGQLSLRDQSWSLNLKYHSSSLIMFPLFIMFPFFLFLDHIFFLYLPWSCFLCSSSLIMFPFFIFLDHVSFFIFLDHFSFVHLPW